MPRISLVGNGHGGSEDYATLALWWSAEATVDYGSQIEAACLGDCGNSATLSGATAHGSSIYTLNVTHTGNNSSLLAEARQLTISTSSAILINDMYIATNNQFFDAFNVQSDALESNRCVFHNRTPGNRAISSGAHPNAQIKNFVAIGGLDVVLCGFDGGIKLTNGLILGGADKGIEASTTPNLISKNNFAFNNAGDDYDSASTITIISSASEDATGTAGLTGYTSAELVDFAGGDYRTKATSALATAGTDTPYVGAFLEASSGITLAVTETLNPFSDSSTTDIDYNVTITTTESFNSFQDSSVLSVTGVGSVSIDATETFNPFTDSSVLSLSANVGAAVTEVLNSFLDSSNVRIAKDIDLTVTETFNSFADNSTVRLPAQWVDKIKVTTSYTIKPAVNTIWTNKG